MTKAAGSKPTNSPVRLTGEWWIIPRQLVSKVLYFSRLICRPSGCAAVFQNQHGGSSAIYRGSADEFFCRRR